MRVVRSTLAASIAVLPVALPLLIACGGSSPQAPAAASPTGATASAASAAPGAPTDPAAAAVAANPGPPTTTTALPDAGELQGAKLQEKSASGASNFDVDAGPGRGPHQQEAGRSPKDIQAIIMAHRDEARACYDRVQQQKGDASMKGNLDVTWTIDPTGAVTNVGVDQSKSDIKDTDVAACIQAIIKGIHFSVSAKGFETRAHYPFNFNPKPKH